MSWWSTVAERVPMTGQNMHYRGQAVDEDRQARLIGLFRLDFADPADTQADVAGAPVWLGLAMTADGLLRLKPQNLLLNLPLARPH